MAPDGKAVSITIYNKSGSIALSIPSGEFMDYDSIWEVLEDSRVVALGITELATAQGGTAEDHSNTLHNYTEGGYNLAIVFYDATPTPTPLYSHGHIDTLHMRHVHEQDDYSAMRGPCPEGYHIPSYNERTSIKAMFSAMGASVNSGTFKVPPTGAYYYGSNSTKHWINQTGSIRCCNTYSNESGAKIYDMRDVYANSKNALMPIRAFKDVPVVPDSSWSVIFDGSSTAVGAGIFWSESLGLFSISSDGINWKTLADKNVGATQVGTNKTAACVGYIFQRGNNHGFTYASTPTFPSTTSTQVDTTGYGPGNYYSSNVYYDGGSDGDWSSPSNNNLWGWTTGIIPGDDYREPVYYGPDSFECYSEYFEEDNWSGPNVGLKGVTSTHGSEIYNKIAEAKIAKHGSASSNITVEEFYDYVSGGECNLDAVPEGYGSQRFMYCFCRDGSSDGMFDVSDSAIPSSYGRGVDRGTCLVGRMLDNGGVEIKYIYDKGSYDIDYNSDYTHGTTVIYFHVPQKVNDYLKANDKSFILSYDLDI